MFKKIRQKKTIILIVSVLILLSMKHLNIMAESKTEKPDNEFKEDNSVILSRTPLPALPLKAAEEDS